MRKGAERLVWTWIRARPVSLSTCSISSYGGTSHPKLQQLRPFGSTINMNGIITPVAPMLRSSPPAHCHRYHRLHRQRNNSEQTRRCINSRTASSRASDEPQTLHSDNDPSSETTTTTTTTDDKNSFRILGLSQRFDIDIDELKQKYRALMGQHHPDRHYHDDDNNNNKQTDDSSAPPSASTITHAYSQLLNPHRRAVHLLELLGKPLLEEDPKGDPTSSGGDLEFLSQVMEIRERIDQTLQTQDNDKGNNNDNNGNDDDTNSAAADQALQPLWDENNLRVQETCQALQQAFAEGNLDEAHRLTGQLQYWNRIDETLREQLSISPR